MNKTFKVAIYVLSDGCSWEIKDMYFDVDAKTYKDAADKVFKMDSPLYCKGVRLMLSVKTNKATRLSGKLFYYDN